MRVLSSFKLRNIFSALLAGSLLAVAAQAQQQPAGGPPGGMPSPADQAIKYRQALYTLIGGNFGPIGAVLQGRAEFNPADVKKRAERTAFLATLVPDAFPEISKTGNTKARPEVWSNPAGFAKASKNLVDSTAALVAVLQKDNSNSEAFRSAAGAVGQACKGCHEDFRAK